MKYTKQSIKELRKGIQDNQLITDEQVAFLAAYGIDTRNLEGHAHDIQCKIDGILRKMSRKKK